MVWVKLDEQFANDPKVVEAGPLGMALHVAALCYSNTNLTDGYVPRSIARRLIDLDGLSYTPQQVIDGLVAVGLWSTVDGGYHVHDDNQPTKAEVLEQQEKKAAAGRKGGKTTQAGAKADAQARAQADAQARASGSSRSSKTQARTRPDTDTEEGNTPPTPPRPDPPATARPDVAAQARPVSVDTRAVFDAWRESTGKHKAKLDGKRTRVIQKALKAYPVEDLLDAVTGWQHSAHHRGENSRHTVYNDLPLLLRDADHIERFRDLARHGPPQPAAAVLGRRSQQMLNNAAGMRRIGIERGLTSVDDLAGVGADRVAAERELPGPADRAADRG